MDCQQAVLVAETWTIEHPHLVGALPMDNATDAARHLLRNDKKQTLETRCQERAKRSPPSLQKQQLLDLQSSPIARKSDGKLLTFLMPSFCLLRLA